jgi:hypothetical protein
MCVLGDGRKVNLLRERIKLIEHAKHPSLNGFELPV